MLPPYNFHRIHENFPCSLLTTSKQARSLGGLCLPCECMIVAIEIANLGTIHQHSGNNIFLLGGYACDSFRSMHRTTPTYAKTLIMGTPRKSLEKNWFVPEVALTFQRL